ncbi:UDP-N-acetylmuramoyl-tripeptide--D-alanyl-D-alanine ligase [Candidatus Uhrbacteria bacterium]|nr:UDP-N-acetylmuramoyl-tripeptide--D-alanyl-D-alanine ligase [Candidatus Uhrbacteria bacterium]
MLLTVTISIVGFILLARSALFWLYFIQAKHYRLDRIWMEMKRSPFYKLLFSGHRIIILVLLLLWILLSIGGAPLYRSRTVWLIFVGLGILAQLYVLIYMLQTAVLYTKGRLQLPQFTIKSIILALIILIAESPLAIYATIFLPALLATELFQPFIVLGVFALAYTPNIFLHHYFISRARKKISAHKNLIVIGITGSYGKTTTKEFLAHILSKKFKVLKTPAHINVDTGVARVILRDLKPEHEIFIVEMGAYKRGEIKKICDLVRPQYAVLTGLSDQHLALFGSLKALVEAKFELVEAILGPSGHIIANADSEPLVQEFKRRRIMPVWYGIRSHAARFKPADILYGEKGTAFTLHGVKFTVPCIGTAALNNLLGAIGAAVELGLHIKDIAPLIHDLPTVPHTMEPKQGPHGALIIDDTYNANTEGVLAALHDLQYFTRAKKIFVFKEIIELGERAQEDHTAIAKAAAHAADYVMLIPGVHRKLMCDTLAAEGMNASQLLDADSLDADSMEKLRAMCDEQTVILCEGRDAQKILNQISSP